MARTFSSRMLPSTPIARRSRARCSMFWNEASTSSAGSSRPLIPAFPDSSR
ncbi:MAG TPA: hypothetical protein VN969_05770 [Streptosporangiaceae bacterium]|nr:hypothetical protein [Streptosporangiaceae bacterium]